MTPEQQAAFINAQVAIFNCRVAAMVAENQYRQNCGSQIAYAEDAFSALEREFAGILGHKSVVGLFLDSMRPT